jgi:predicted unusual protein kinase regulating ubiquinone biosynthesis (AarF/ABC1/UbiB family)
MQAEHTAKQEKIDNSLKQEFAEFLADSQTNPAKELMYKALRSIGGITTSDDMKVFVDYYSQMAKYEREQAIKEFQAQKVIEETKNKAQIDGNFNGIVQGDSVPTLEAIGRMTQEEYNAAVDKWGLEKILKAK